MRLVDKYDALFLDLDGTVWEGGRPIAHAVESITAAGLSTMYITNNASRAPQAVADMLRGMGLEATADQVMTSAQAAVDMASKKVAAKSTPRALVLGTDSFCQLARAGGFTVVSSADDNPHVVLHGHSPDTGWAQLSEAALAINNGAMYLASNLDSTLPQERGLMVGNGSMVAAVTHATGVKPQSAGKPEPAMFTAAKEKLAAQAPLAVGDRLNTDIVGGNRAGQPTLHVLTGVSGPLALLRAEPEERPTYIAADMRGLFQQEAELLPGEHGGFSARIKGTESAGTTVELNGGSAASTPLDALLTVLAASPEPITQVQPASDAARRCVEQWW